jgi:hypothetical protein
METGTKIALWVTAGVVGLLAVVGIAEEARAATPANPLLQVVTDPGTVKQFQTIIATAIANGQGNLLVSPGTNAPTTADYAMSDVDGNPANAKWMAVLANFQRYVDASLPQIAAAGKLPAGYPSTLRTDGVLDYATAIAITAS